MKLSLFLDEILKDEVIWGQWYISIIPALRKLRQEDDEFEGSLGYIVRSCQKKRKV
jgi:hypothetical protein